MTKTKIALAAALVLGASATAFAEDSSTSFPQNVYGQQSRYGYSQTFVNRDVGLTTRDVALPQGQVYQDEVYARAPQFGGGYDRASSSYGGSSF